MNYQNVSACLTDSGTDMCRLQDCDNQVSSADNDESVAEDELEDDCDYKIYQEHCILLQLRT